jgi:hypothetical protein
MFAFEGPEPKAPVSTLVSEIQLKIVVLPTPAIPIIPQ